MTVLYTAIELRYKLPVFIPYQEANSNQRDNIKKKDSSLCLSFGSE
jgi:hypothetical protein